MKRFKKIVKRTMVTLISIILLLVVVAYFYMQKPLFGALPEGGRLKKVEASTHFRDGKFRNAIEKPTITEGYSIWKEAYKALFEKVERQKPTEPMPSIKTDLRSLHADSNLLVWFGHSSFYMQIDGVKILVDPIFSGSASPLPGGVKAFAGTDIYTAADFPDIDYMLLSHDHYDHLDYETALAFKNKVKHVVCGLGAGAHYERWGYTSEQIIEKDWLEKVEVKPGFTIYTEPTQHTSGRGFTSAKALWLAFFIQTPNLTVYYSGDGGHDERFKAFNQRFGTVDWAIMECGQYNKAWQYVHELPEEVALSTTQLQARNLLPVHHSKFVLSRHAWDEPLEEMTRLAEGKDYRLVTPLIGETVRLNDSTQTFQQWWKTVK